MADAVAGALLLFPVRRIDRRLRAEHRKERFSSRERSITCPPAFRARAASSAVTVAIAPEIPAIMSASAIRAAAAAPDRESAARGEPAHGFGPACPKPGSPA